MKGSDTTPNPAWDRLTVAAACAGLAATLLPWLVTKPNRVVQGTAVALWEAVPAALAVGFVGVWALVLALSRRDLLPKARIWLMAAGANLVPLLFYLVAFRSQDLAPSAAARVSVSWGLYLTLFACYMVLISFRHEARGYPRLVAVLSWGTPLALVALLLGGYFEQLAIVKEFHVRQDKFFFELTRHLTLTGTAVGSATLLGIPLGVWAYRRRWLEKPIFVFVNSVQTIPSLALFGLMIAPLAYLSFRFPVLRSLGIAGIGAAPAMIALTLYALLPIVRNAYTGLKVLPPALLEAGRGMGMSRFQVLRMIEVPVATPLILSGIRIATVQTVGNTAVAALIGAGGFGAFIFQGLGQAADDLILLGAMPVIAMAMVVDRALRLLIDTVSPQGIRSTEAAPA